MNLLIWELWDEYCAEFLPHFVQLKIRFCLRYIYHGQVNHYGMQVFCHMLKLMFRLLGFNRLDMSIMSTFLRDIFLAILTTEHFLLRHQMLSELFVTRQNSNINYKAKTKTKIRFNDRRGSFRIFLKLIEKVFVSA